MKTILEHLNTLPEPYRSEAVENCEERRKNQSVDTLWVALHTAFAWQVTPQGLSYWAKLLDSL